LKKTKNEERKGPSVLIVDDESNVALTLQMIFEEVGYAITTADSCRTALTILRHARTFDAVITDLCMEEERSGLQVAMQAAQLHPRPVIVMVTGFGTFENVKAATGTVVDYFALKPLDLDELKRAVARLVALRRDRLA
jgi:DNA-binding NtrC family response regulator